MNGTLAIKIVSYTPAHAGAAAKYPDLGLKFKIGSVIKDTKSFQPSDNVDETVSFDLKDAAGDDEVLIEACLDREKSRKHMWPDAHFRVLLSNLLTATWTRCHLSKTFSFKVDIESKWTVNHPTQELSDESSVHLADQIEEVAEGFVTVDLPPQERPQLRSMLGAIITQLLRTNDQLQTMNNRLDSKDGRLQAIDDCPDSPASQPMTSMMEAIADQLEDAGDQLHNTNNQLEGMNKWLAKLETRLQPIEDHVG